MHTGKRFTPWEFFRWTRCDTYWMLAIAAIPTALYALGWKFLALPWQPIAILGTAMAFIVGFKNNASYNRIWEARQIYGAIINNSRSFAYTLRDALGGKNSEIARRMIYRHIAWLTALRYQLRDSRSWETMNERSNLEFQQSHYEIPERDGKLGETLREFLSEDELRYILSKKNRATQLTAMQSEEIARLRSSAQINDFQWTQLQQALVRLTDDQGRLNASRIFRIRETLHRSRLICFSYS